MQLDLGSGDQGLGFRVVGLECPEVTAPRMLGVGYGRKSGTALTSTSISLSMKIRRFNNALTSSDAISKSGVADLESQKDKVELPDFAIRQPRCSMVEEGEEDEAKIQNRRKSCELGTLLTKQESLVVV